LAFLFFKGWCVFFSVSVAEPEPQGDASIRWCRSHNVIRFRLRTWYKT
jgi:hypothetical protein